MAKIKKIFKVLFFVFLVLLILLLAVWFVLRGFRHQWAKHFLNQASQSAEEKERIILLAKALALTPTSYAPYLELGKIALANKKYQQAEKFFSWSARLNKNNTQTYLWLAKSQINQEKYQAAEKSINQAKAIEPTHPEIVFLEAILAINKEQWNKAEKKLETIKNQDKNYETAYVLTMLSAEKNDKIKKVKFNENQQIIQKYSQSENPVFKKAFLAYWWLKNGQERVGCKLIKELKEQNQDLWAKLKQYQQTFKVCF